MAQPGPKPDWLRVRLPGGDAHRDLRKTLRQLELHTVCEHARCPNVGECWRAGTATVMLLGERCSRNCRFCAVTGGPLEAARDRGEPGRVARAVAQLGLRYVVLTMVTRDDLPDGGAGHVAETVERLRALQPDLLVEALVSDFGGDERAADTVLAAAPDVFAHNVEVVREHSEAVRDPRCDFDRSLTMLRYAKARAPACLCKSSLMVGVGETDEQVLRALEELRDAGVDLVTIGQYLRPTVRHHPVSRYVDPESFAAYRQAGLAMGFDYVASGPLVRSSYRAAEAFVAGRPR